MPSSDGAEKFRLGINMAGAISAGAYTAGVLDFLIEALDEWHDAKSAYTPGSSSPAKVPMHDVTIEALGGASAGGMCAAIAAIALQSKFDHVRTARNTGKTNNALYESWVNRISIGDLLRDDDLKNNPRLRSLLDSTVIDGIAGQILKPPETVVKRPYVSPNLNLFLTLTNVRGVPYKLYPDAGDSLDEFAAYYGDRLQFEVVEGAETPSMAGAKPLRIDDPDEPNWNLLRLAAMATGAFPVFLAPRAIERDTTDYDRPMWKPLCEPPCKPASGKDPMPCFDKEPDWRTLNVDGGLTNNSPFQLVHDFLAKLDPPVKDCMNPRKAEEASRAVLTIAPFPAEHKCGEPADGFTLAQIVLRLVNVLLSQSRFSGESLEVLMDRSAFSRFAIAPSWGIDLADGDPKSGRTPLQSACLSAFGGFFDRGFRRHDFLLGRRNCQAFLKNHFALPASNPIIQNGLQKAGWTEAAVPKEFLCKPLDNTVGGGTWVQIIPLVGTAQDEAPVPERAAITQAQLDAITDQIFERLRAIRPLLLQGVPFGWVARVALWAPLAFFVKKEVKKVLAKGLGENFKPE